MLINRIKERIKKEEKRAIKKLSNTKSKQKTEKVFT